MYEDENKLLKDKINALELDQIKQRSKSTLMNTQSNLFTLIPTLAPKDVNTVQRLIDRRRKVLKIATLEVVWQTLDEQAEILEKTINSAKLVKRLAALSLKLGDIENKVNTCFRSRISEKDFTNKFLCDQLAEQNRQQ